MTDCKLQDEINTVLLKLLLVMVFILATESKLEQIFFFLESDFCGSFSNENWKNRPTLIIQIKQKFSLMLAYE